MDSAAAAEGGAAGRGPRAWRRWFLLDASSNRPLRPTIRDSAAAQARRGLQGPRSATAPCMLVPPTHPTAPKAARPHRSPMACTGASTSAHAHKTRIADCILRGVWGRLEAAGRVVYVLAWKLQQRKLVNAGGQAAQGRQIRRRSLSHRRAPTTSRHNVRRIPVRPPAAMPAWHVNVWPGATVDALNGVAVHAATQREVQAAAVHGDCTSAARTSDGPTAGLAQRVSPTQGVPESPRVARVMAHGRMWWPGAPQQPKSLGGGGGGGGGSADSRQRTAHALPSKMETG